MCGIAGILSLDGAPVYEREIRRMCDAMVSRGPDGAGYLVTPQLGLGMRRLSIIDLATGDQPQANEDGSVQVVFNGEIYNYRELARELRRRGHRFSTESDTESIVHLYEDHGAACVEHLRGMFAFACWDARRQRLLLARDRLGIKPLYYVETGGRLAFASELKALLELEDVERRLDGRSLSHLLAFLATPLTDSIVAGVRKLAPGHLLVAAPGRPLRVERYWDVAFEPDRGRSEESLVEELRALLEEVVRLHMVSDVPLGAFLSGGIDSSAVVAHMARLSERPVKTFSIGFADEEWSELPEARRVARRFATEHHELVLEPGVVSLLEKVALSMDEPFGDPSAIPTYMVSKLAAEHVKVVLSGDGGDELFAGYDRYLVESRERAWRLLPRPAGRLLGGLAARLPEGTRGRRFLRHVALPTRERYLDAVTLFGREQQRRLLRPELLAGLGGSDPWREELARPPGAGHWLSALQALDLRGYLPLDILTKVDRMSMAHSLEARPPLLDHKLVEFAARVPPELQLVRGETKALFRKALRGLLPDATIARGKRGFAIPLGRWFRGELRGFVRELLLAPGSRSREVFEPAELLRVVETQDPRESFGFPLFTLLSFELWCRASLGPRRPAELRPAPLARPAQLAGAAGGGAR
jgi:asparagine synthase (glutamine-hydrolysing)